MSTKNQLIKLREVNIPEDYVQMAELFNLIEPGSTSVVNNIFPNRFGKVLKGIYQQMLK